MEPERLREAVRTTLAVVARISKRTRSPADDLLVAILRSSEERIADAVLKLLDGLDQPPTDEQITEVLKQTGIRL